MNTAIFQVLAYFSFFDYPPTIEELHTFLPSKASKSQLIAELQKMKKDGKLEFLGDRIAQKSNLLKKYQERFEYSVLMQKKARSYLNILKYLPFTWYGGISGSMSMMNAKKGDDIDIFIIVEPQTLWTTRFLILIYKKTLSFMYPTIGNKLCFNLFFSSNSLTIEKHKQTEYIGHEILQLKTLFDKGNTYDHFISSNPWIQNFFPNVQIKSVKKKTEKIYQQQSNILYGIEHMLGKVQKWWLWRKGYSWDEENGILSLIQQDFEKKIKGGGGGSRTHESAFRRSQV